jgi:hypothetical protein
MSIKFLDPTYKRSITDFTYAPRLESFKDSVVAIISNGKRGTIPFFDCLETELKERHQVAEVVRIIKSNYSTPVDSLLLNDAERWNAMISGIGD